MPWVYEAILVYLKPESLKSQNELHSASIAISN